MHLSELRLPLLALSGTATSSWCFKFTDRQQQLDRQQRLLVRRAQQVQGSETCLGLAGSCFFVSLIDVSKGIGIVDRSARIAWVLAQSGQIVSALSSFAHGLPL